MRNEFYADLVFFFKVHTCFYRTRYETIQIPVGDQETAICIVWEYLTNYTDPQTIKLLGLYDKAYFNLKKDWTAKQNTVVNQLISKLKKSKATNQRPPDSDNIVDNSNNTSTTTDPNTATTNNIGISNNDNDNTAIANINASNLTTNNGKATDFQNANAVLEWDVLVNPPTAVKKKLTPQQYLNLYAKKIACKYWKVITEVVPELYNLHLDRIALDEANRVANALVIRDATELATTEINKALEDEQPIQRENLNSVIDQRIQIDKCTTEKHKQRQREKKTQKSNVVTPNKRKLDNMDDAINDMGTLNDSNKKQRNGHNGSSVKVTQKSSNKKRKGSSSSSSITKTAGTQPTTLFEDQKETGKEDDETVATTNVSTIPPLPPIPYGHPNTWGGHTQFHSPPQVNRMQHEQPFTHSDYDYRHFYDDNYQQYDYNQIQYDDGYNHTFTHFRDGPYHPIRGRGHRWLHGRG